MSNEGALGQPPAPALSGQPLVPVNINLSMNPYPSPRRRVGISVTRVACSRMRRLAGSRTNYLSWSVAAMSRLACSRTVLPTHWKTDRFERSGLACSRTISLGL